MDLPRRRIGGQRYGARLHRHEDGRDRSLQRSDAARQEPRGDAGRPAILQQLYQAEFQPFRAVSAQVRAQRPPGNRARAGRSDLRNVFLDARHRGAAFRGPGGGQKQTCAARHGPPGIVLPQQKAVAGEERRRIADLPAGGPGRQDLGTPRAEKPARARHPRSRALDAGAHPIHRRPGRHLPLDDVPHHGAGIAGLPRRPPRSDRGDQTLREPADRNGNALPVPALRLTRLGHRHLRLRAGRTGSGRDRSGPDEPMRRLAAGQGSSPQGRLERQAPRPGTQRLGVRIRQRVLSRHRRYRHGAAGAAACQSVRPGAPGPRGKTRGHLAIGNAVARWRMGRLRRR